MKNIIMHNYTDSPWTYEMISNDAARIWGPNNTFVAECWKPHGKAYPTKANARLIAAAPELLAACEEALNLFEKIRMSTDDTSLKLYRVIKKAKGE